MKRSISSGPVYKFMLAQSQPASPDFSAQIHVLVYSAIMPGRQHIRRLVCYFHFIIDHKNAGLALTYQRPHYSPPIACRRIAL